MTPTNKPNQTPSSQPTSRTTTQPSTKPPLTPQKLREHAKKVIEEKKEEGKKQLELTKRKGMRNAERGYNQWRRIIDLRVKEIEKAGTNAYQKAKEVTLQAGKGLKSMQEQLDKITDEYENLITGTVEPLIQTLTTVLRGKEYLTAKDLEEFKRVYKVYRDQFEKQLSKNPKLRKGLTELIGQLREGKPLETKQLEALRGLINAKSIREMSTIENTQIGFFLNLMNPSQKTQFLRDVIKSPKNGPHAVKIIDSLIKTAVISVRQGHELMQEALANPTAGSEVTAAARQEILRKFTNGTYNRLQNETLQGRQRVVKQLQENFYKNPAMRYLSGTSVTGIISFIWGFLTASLNLIVNRGRLNKEALLGISAMAVGTMAIQKGRQTDRRGILGLDSPYTEFTRGLIFRENKQTAEQFKRSEHIQTFADIYSNFPLNDYFNSGGFDTFWREYQARKRGQAHIDKTKFKKQVTINSVTYRDLVRLESKPGSGNARRLESLKRAIQLVPGANKQQKIKHFDNLLKRLAKAAEDTGKKSTKDYRSGIEAIRELYGLNKPKTTKKTKK